MEFLYLSIYVLVAALLSLLYWKVISMSTPKNFPPGPIGIPLLGSVHYLAGRPHVAMKRLAKKYGNVFSLRFFHLNIVCVNGFDELRELMVEKAKEICDRPDIVSKPPIKQELSSGIVQGSYGTNWKSNRTLFQKAIRELAKHNSIENVIERETSRMMENIAKKIRDNDSVDPNKILNFAALNVITSYVFGEVFESDCEKMKHIFRLNYDFFSNSPPNPVYIVLFSFPIMKKIWVPNFMRVIQDRKREMTQFCKDEIERHKKKLDLNCPKDFIDYYLIYMKHMDKDVANESELCSTLIDLFQAGMGSVATTVLWSILYMAKHQDIQKKVHEEIEQVLGLDRQATFDDRENMPYITATIHEVQRFSTAVPITMAHSPIKDSSLQGYNIPKGTIVIPNQHSTNFQPDKWKNPNEFDPRNFLDEDDNFQHNDAFMLFGGGLRVCLGKPIAKIELFLFFVAILQKYHIEPEPGVELSYDAIHGLILFPKPYKYRFIERDRHTYQRKFSG